MCAHKSFREWLVPASSLRRDLNDPLIQLLPGEKSDYRGPTKQSEQWIWLHSHSNVLKLCSESKWKQTLEENIDQSIPFELWGISIDIQKPLQIGFHEASQWISEQPAPGAIISTSIFRDEIW